MLLELTADEALDLVRNVAFATMRKLTAQGKDMPERFDGSIVVEVPGKLSGDWEPEAA